MTAVIVQMHPRPAATAFDPGVPPFDPMNPHHVRAWNSVFALGKTELAKKTPRYVSRSEDPHPILADIARYLRDKRMSATRFGVDALGDPNLVEDIRCGRNIGRTTERRLREFMAKAGWS